MKSHRMTRAAGFLLAPLLAGGAIIAQGAAASADNAVSASPRVVFVSPSATPGGIDHSCGSASYTSIQSAIDAVSAHGGVVVCPGTYYEQVVVAKPVTLRGRHATIDETGVIPGFQVDVPHSGLQTIYAAVVIASSYVRVSGFKVRNAEGEGILAAGPGDTIQHLLIQHNAVVNNDTGATAVSPGYFECQAIGQVPGDCGEGVHLINVANSTVGHNYVAGNAGGILLTDEMGPTHHNLITGNHVVNNTLDCGITVPGHNPNALTSGGVRQPAVAGVYDNVISRNVVTGNGTEGEGAGVLFANAGPGTAVYGNVVRHNHIAGNGQAGVTFHAHTLGAGEFEDLSGNSVIHNVIGENNLDGDPLDTSDVATGVAQTTGVLVYSGGTPVSVTIARNHIFDNYYGIWLSAPVTATGLPTNTFHNVTVPIYTAPAP